MSNLRAQIRNRSELGVALLLAALGALVLWDTTRIATGFAARGPISSTTLPRLIGVSLLVCAVLLAVDVLRGGHGESETGEDIDLGTGSDWRTGGLLSAAFLANVVLIERLGWPLSGALLFWGCAYALGSRHYLRDALVGLALAFLSYVLFARGLGIGLPAGVLDQVL